MLTLEQCARRAATRRNNKIKQTLPLLAEQWATTPEAEAERIVRQRAAAQEHLARMAEADRAQWYMGEERRAIAAGILSPEKWQSHEELWKRTFPYAKPETHGFDLANWWWQALKGTTWNCCSCSNSSRQSRRICNQSAAQGRHYQAFRGSNAISPARVIRRCSCFNSKQEHKKPCH